MHSNIWVSLWIKVAIRKKEVMDKVMEFQLPFSSGQDTAQWWMSALLADALQGHDTHPAVVSLYRRQLSVHFLLPAIIAVTPQW